MKILSKAIIALVLVVAVPGSIAQKQSDPKTPCPMHESHMGMDAHHATVERHGDEAMGFPHDKTMHHFRLAENGGAIEVTANDPKDSPNIEAIRMHLEHIARSFSEGDFSIPMFVHDSIPPGVTTMKLMKEKIHFAYEQIDAGGRVSIATEDPIARAAIHDFLRFQITDHGTGDPLETAAAH
jgi:hypothetical protein